MLLRISTPVSLQAKTVATGLHYSSTLLFNTRVSSTSLSPAFASSNPAQLVQSAPLKSSRRLLSAALHSTIRTKHYCSAMAGAHTADGLYYPDPIIKHPAAAHTASVIMLHGLGDTGAGWAEIAEMFTAGGPGGGGQLAHIKWIFPNAPTRPITLNGGMAMPGWHDISSLEKINNAYEEDEAGLQASAQYVEDLIRAEEAAGISSSRVLVAGFSQGGAIALMMLRRDIPLAGVVGMSTYLPLAGDSPLVSAVNTATRVLCCHGTADQVVSYAIGKESYAALRKAGAHLEEKSYGGMGHEAWPDEMNAVKSFFSEVLP